MIATSGKIKCFWEKSQTLLDVQTVDNGIVKEKPMSSDNGIYICEFPNQEWRVIHAQAIDNLSYEPDDEDGFNSVQVINYCNVGAATFGSKEQAMVHAHRMAEDYEILEYGVSVIKFPHTIDQYQRRALLNRSR